MAKTSSTQAGETVPHSKPKHVAVLGGGIMGSSVALFLARRGVHVSLFDAAPVPFARASRWNEGKIHLGYLYSGDRSMATVHRLLPGGLHFKQLTEELIGCSLTEAITPADDLYLVHRDSVADPQAMQRHYEAVTELARSHPDASFYLTDLSTARLQTLNRREIEAVCNSNEVVAGYVVPERSVRTTWVADRFVHALAAEARIDLVMATHIKRVRPAGSNGRWRIVSEPSTDASFDAVVNALWEGLIAVDDSVGIRPTASWSHRLRLSLFVHTSREINTPSAVLAIGPFGDVKNYTGRDFYLSWYNAGLIAEGEALHPPDFPGLDAAGKRAIASTIIDKLTGVLPFVRDIAADTVELRLEGGWVFAFGTGPLTDPRSTLHRRDQLGIAQLGSYVSVNTGKYSIAPWLAREVTDRLLA